LEEKKYPSLIKTFRRIPENLDESSIPKRPWIVAGELLAGHVSALLASGGTGKSLYALMEAISVASGKQLLPGRLKIPASPVLLINHEDDFDEIMRRCAAIRQRYALDPADYRNNLIIKARDDAPFTVAEEIGGSVIITPHVDEMTDFIKQHNIKLLSVDPFVSTHGLPENDNVKINQAVQQYKNITYATQCAARVIHHTRKSGQDSEAVAGDVESSRGAKSLTEAARAAHTMAKMNKQTACNWNISEADRRRLVRFDDAKGNYAPPEDEARWFYLSSTTIANGEEVGVLEHTELEQHGERTETEEDSKTKIEQNIARAIIRKYGEGRRVKWAEVAPDYCDIAKRQKTAAAEHVKRLAPNKKMSGVFTIGDGKDTWRIWQEKGEKQTDPRYVTLEAQD
jgi:hypothetical protein